MYYSDQVGKFAKGGKLGEGYVIVERYFEDDELKKVYFKEGEKNRDLDEATLFYTRREAEKFIKGDAWLNHLGEYVYVEQVKVITDHSDRGHTLELTNYAKGGTLDKLGINSLDLGKLKKQITKEGKSLKKKGKKSVVGYTSIDNHIKYAFKKSDEYINGSEGTKESRLSNAIFTLTEALEEMKEEKKLLYKIEIKEVITGDGRKFYFQERNPKDFQDEIDDIISENNDMSVEYVDIFSYKKDKEDEAEYRGNLVYENKKKKNTSKKLKSSIKKELKDYSDDNNLIDY